MKYAGLVARANHHAGIKKVALSSLSVTPALVAILGSAPAFAQAQTAQQADQASQVQEVVVTGTRVVRDGYEAPTPVSVVTAEEIQNSATPNIADYVNTLPAITGSQTPQTMASNVGQGWQGVNAIDVRGIGQVRTLTLLDGRRVGGAIATGVVDVSELPQQLISRVDVVTGGASAAYGSDALAGVVNFVLDTKYTGFKGEVSGGVTTYGDDRNWKIDMTGGTGFAGDRGHFLVSGEASYEDGIPLNTRPWNQVGWQFINNPAYTATSGQPQVLLLPQVGLSVATTGGEIACAATSACKALRGIAFGPGGTPYNVSFGSVVADPYMSGGSWNGPAYIRTSEGSALLPRQNRQNLFTRASYDISDDWSVFTEMSWAHLNSASKITGVFYPGNLTIKADNAFIPASVATQVAALGITSFPFGTFNADLPVMGSDSEHRSVRFVGGVDGKFDAFHTNWKLNAYVESAFSQLRNTATNSLFVPNYMAAIDAVKGPNGTIVCRTYLTNPSCVPYDVFGSGVNNQAAANFVEGTPFQVSRFLEDVESLNITGEPFSDWAGPVSIATGIEHRTEKARGIADPQTQASTANWLFNGGLPAVGSFAVTEGYVETVVPLAKDQAWAKSLDFNGAIRATGYDSGTVATWKVGAEYTPISDIRFRATESRDVREPNLYELYAGPFQSQTPINDPFNGGASATSQSLTSGNAKLVPEVATSTSAGVVVQPVFLPGFSASFDYYGINITQAINTFTAQQEMNLCYSGNAAACALVVKQPAGSTNMYIINIAPVNLAAEHVNGFDIEAGYQFKLQDIVSGWGGAIGIRGLATHFLNDTIYSGLPGSIPQQIVGQAFGNGNAGSGVPKWRYQLAIAYTLDPVIITATMRGLSAGVVNTNYIQCTSGCPAATANNPTYSNNFVAGATYFDLSAVYKLGGDHVQSELFLNVRNLANKDPAIVAQGPGGSAFSSAAINPALYDTLGRTFRMGVRFKM